MTAEPRPDDAGEPDLDDVGVTGQSAVDDLIRLLDLEQIEEDIFRGWTSRARWQRVFGGQVAGQAMVAVGRTVEPDRRVTRPSSAA